MRVCGGACRARVNAPILAMCIFWVSVWYLFSDAGCTSGGMPGDDIFSSGLNAFP